MRPPAFQQHFETIETRVPVVTPERTESVEKRPERRDIAVIGPIAAVVLALTISTLVLDQPAARVVAAALATLGMVVAVVLMLMGKRPEAGRHVARHRMEE